MTVGLHVSCPGLPDVVKERSQTQNDGGGWGGVTGVERMCEYVVAVKASLLDAFAFEQLREDDAEDARVAHQEKAHGRKGRFEGLQNLVSHPLSGYHCKHVKGAGNGSQGGLVHGKGKLRGEPAGSQGAEAVLAETRSRVADCPDELCGKIPAPLVRVDHRVGEKVICHRVDREIAAGKIIENGRRESHAVGPAAVAVSGLRAERRHFERRPLVEHGHRPMLDAGGNHATKELRDLIRERIRCHVEIRVAPPQEDVTHRAAHQVALETGLLERSRKILDDTGEAHCRSSKQAEAEGVNKKAALRQS